jgi:CxxC motif-containing protein
VWIGGIEYGDEDVDHPHRIVFSHVIVEELGEQNALRSVFALNKALHQEPRPQGVKILTQPTFSHRRAGRPETGKE